MKLNKFSITILLLISITIITYGYVNNKKASITNAQNTPQVRIIGTWIMENSPDDKIEFLANGELKWYEYNVLKYTDTYSLTNTCDGDIMTNNELFLKIIDGVDGSESCMYFNGITDDNQSLSLTPAGSMKVIIYLKQ